MPKIIKNWGIERKETKDPLTGRRMWQLTNNPAMSSHFYFTRTSWIYDRYLCFVSDRSGSSNLFMFDPDDWSILQLTDLPPYKGDKYWLTYDKKRLHAEHNLGFGHIVMTATADPQGHGLYFDSGVLEQNLLRYDFDTGQVATVMEKAAGCICGSGRYSLYTQSEDNYTTRIRHSRLFKIDLKTGTRELILEEDGDFAHMFCCPADPNLVIWINYHQGQGRTFNLATGALGGWRRFKHPGNAYYHYSFLPNSSLILTAHVEPRSQTPPPADVVWTIQKPDGTLVDTLESFTSINHATASHNHRRVIGDTRCDLQKKSALHLWDRDTRRTEPFCQCNAGFNGQDKDGYYYDEWFHPRPGFSPDDRYVLFTSDCGTFVTQLYLVELG